MTAGVAGGVTGAVDAKLMVFIRGFSSSSIGVGFEKFGGCGNLESENDAGVG